MTLEKIADFKGVLLKGISSLCFSEDGQKLLGTAIDDDHHIAVFNVAKNETILHVKGGRENILSSCFTGVNDFTTVGVKHIKFWNITGKDAKGKNAG